jgi:hypothetical protein
MKVFLTYVLLAQLVFGFGVKTFIVLEWKIKQDEITEKYCENKDKPMMNCNGKCYLSKQLQNLAFQEEEERKKNPSPITQVETTNFAWIHKDMLPTVDIQVVNEDAKLGLSKPFYWYTAPLPSIDHPPRT